MIDSIHFINSDIFIGFIVFQLCKFRVYISSDVLTLFLEAFLQCDFLTFVWIKLHLYIVTKSFYSIY